MKKLSILLILFTFLFVNSCAKKETKTATAIKVTAFTPVSIKVGMITDVAGLGDQSFNDSAYQGLKQAEDQLGVGVQVLQSNAMTDYEPNLANLADLGHKIIFSIGFLTTDAVKEVAPLYPDTYFCLVDGIVDAPNVVSCTFKEEEGSFLAGALAGMMTKTNKVGFLGGMNVPLIQKFETGYKAGVASVNPKATVLVKYTGDFEDVSKGKDSASIMFSQGADIIYHASGKCGLGAIQAAKNLPPGNYIIGVDANQDALGVVKDKNGKIIKTVVLTSMVKNVGVAVFDMIKKFKSGEFKVGHYVYGLKEGGVSLTPMEFTRSKVPLEVIKKLDLIRQKIISGEIQVPDSLEKLSSFKKPKL